MSVLSTTVLLAAEVAPEESTVRPGPIAFAIFVLLAVATFFLWRSMNRHLKKVPPTFGGDQAAPSDTGPAEDPPAATGAPDDDAPR